MEMTITIPEYNSVDGISLKWEKGFEIETKITDNEITISANREGLISLAVQLLTLAQDNVPLHAHLHLDEYNSLEEGSLGLLIQKK